MKEEDKMRKTTKTGKKLGEGRQAAAVMCTDAHATEQGCVCVCVMCRMCVGVCGYTPAVVQSWGSVWSCSSCSACAAALVPSKDLSADSSPDGPETKNT